MVCVCSARDSKLLSKSELISLSEYWRIERRLVMSYIIRKIDNALITCS